jgi:MFS family permease
MEVLNRLRERWDIVTLAVIASLRGTWYNMRAVVWQPFVLSMGIPLRSLGGLESLMDLIKISVQPIVGSASDVYGRKRFLIAREVLTITAGVLFILAHSWHFLFIGVILIGLSAAILPIWNSTVAESTESPELGFIYSVIGTCQMSVGLVATLAAGLIADAYGYTSVFVVATVFGMLSLLIVFTRLVEKKERRFAPSFSWRDLAGSVIGALNPPHHLRGFYIAMALDLFAFNMGYRLLNGMLVKGYGYTPYMLGVLAAVTTGSMAISQVPLGRLVDHVGYVRFLAISQLTSCGVLGLVVWSKRFEIVLAAQALMGLSSALWMPAEQAWIASNVDPEERAQALGSYSTFRGFLSFPAPFIGGVLFDAYGFDLPILLNLVLALIDAALLMILVKD